MGSVDSGLGTRPSPESLDSVSHQEHCPSDPAILLRPKELGPRTAREQAHSGALPAAGDCPGGPCPEWTERQFSEVRQSGHKMETPTTQTLLDAAGCVYRCNPMTTVLLLSGPVCEPAQPSWCRSSSCLIMLSLQGSMCWQVQSWSPVSPVTGQ